MSDDGHDAAGGAPLVGERRRSHGRDVLVVHTSDGDVVARVDLAAGEVTLERPELREAFEQFLERWRAHHDASG